MGLILLDIATDFATGIDFNNVAQSTTQAAQGAISFSNPTLLIVAAILIIATIVLILHLKKIIENSIIGGILWGISVFIFHADLPLVPSFVVSVIFGPAGIGAMIVLKFFGLI
jgi:hypothetical protein